MASERLKGNTQQCLLALLCFSKKYGAKLGMQLRPEHFDGVRRDLAQAIFEYRSKYKGKPPGKKNLPALVENLPLQEERLKTAQHEAREILRLYKKGFNKDWVAEQGIKFAKRQLLKAGVKEAVDIVLRSEDFDIEEVEKVLHKTLRNEPDQIKPSIRFGSPESLRFLEYVDDGWAIGITEFDKAGLRLKPGTLTLYLGPKNTGKSWSCIHVARSCLMQGARVVHLSLEMNQDQVFQRYYQNWFSMPTRLKKLVRAEFKEDNAGRAVGWTQIQLDPPELTLDDPTIKSKLRQLLQPWKQKLSRLIVADFPTGTLTITQLENYLDNLASNEEFHPDVLIIDYPDLMRVSRQNYRLDLGEIYVQLRGLAIRRNLALFCPTQTNRDSFTRKEITSANVAEDVSKLFTADNVLIYSQTKDEKKFGLARLTLQHARDVEVGMVVCLVQHYPTGQYVVRSALATPQYMRLISEKRKDGEAEGGDDSGLV